MKSNISILNLRFYIFTISISLLMLPSVNAQAPLDPELITFQSGFSDAVAVRNANDGSNRMFVVEQGGRIKIIKNGTTLATPFLDIDPLTNGGGEQGLLGLAFHPNYVSNGFFFVNYTNTSGDTVIARYTVSAADPDVADPNSRLNIISIDQDFSNHNGGDIHFSPADGYLYIGMGDGGSGNDPCDRGQTKSPDSLNNTGSCAADNSFTGNDDSRALLGSMIRIDIDNPGTNVSNACGEGLNYGIPADNPFSAVSTDCGEIWAWGLRNPYRFGFDRDTGDLFIGDVGQNAREEVDFQPATSAGGENYGWVCREGLIQTPGQSCTAVGAVDPIIDYAIGCSVIGGFPYRGPETTWQGTYIYADFCTGDLYWSVQDNGTWSGFAELDETFTNVRGFGEDEAGNLYYVSSSQVVQISDANFDDDIIFINGFED